MKKSFRWGIAFVAIMTLAAFAWQPDKPLQILEQRWASAPSQWLRLNIEATNDSAATEINLHLRDEGPRNDPHPIVLLHGTGSSLHTWDGWTEQLVANRRVVRIDLPGFGLTGGFGDSNYSLLRYNATLSALMEALKLPPSIIVGNSLGGMLAWRYSLHAPERVHKLVLITAIGYPLRIRDMPVGFVLPQLPILKHAVPYSLPRFTIEDSLRRVYTDQKKITPALVDRYFELALRPGNRQALVDQFDYRRSGELYGQTAPLIPTVRKPTFILWGEDDKLVPLEHARWFKRDIASSQLVVLPRLGHVPMEEDPVQSLAAVRSFLN